MNKCFAPSLTILLSLSIEGRFVPSEVEVSRCGEP